MLYALDVTKPPFLVCCFIMGIPTAGEVQNHDHGDPGCINKPQRMTASVRQTAIPEMSKIQIVPGMSRCKKSQPGNSMDEENMKNIIEERHFAEYNYFPAEAAMNIFNQ